MRGLTLKMLFAIMMIGACVVAAPQIHCENPSYQFGTVDSSTTVETSFLIQNTGDEPLVFTKVRNCCGVSSQLSSMTIPSGSNAVLSVHFNLEGRKGPQLKTIYLISNDPKEPFYKIRLMGRVEQKESVLSSEESADAPPSASSAGISNETVLVEYFYEPGCPECEKVRTVVFPDLQRQFSGQYILRFHDVGVTSNFMKLVNYQHQLSMDDNASVSVIGKRFFDC